MPGDLDDAAPLLDAGDRGRALSRLIDLDAQLQHWFHVATAPRVSNAAMAPLLLRGPADRASIELRLARWATLFTEEIEVVHDVRNRAVHAVWVPTSDLERCAEIGARVLNLLLSPGPTTPTA